MTLIERLRNYDYDQKDYDSLANQAADEIERLTKENEELRKDKEAFYKVATEKIEELATLRHQLAECQTELEAVRKDAASLWMILDDIDTADDMAKADEVLYRSLVRRTHAKRFEDRYKWVLNDIDAMRGEGE